MANNHEISLLAFCKHPNICQYICSYHVKDTAWIILEFLEGGTLTQTVSRHTFVENEVCFVTVQLLRGIRYMHENQLAHRDIKSPNVMFTVSGVVKLIDLGIVADLSVTPTRTEIVGSPLWVPPEMIRQAPHDYKVDIWSLAICLLELCNGHPPRHKLSIGAMFETVRVGVPEPFEVPEKWSTVFLNFIQRCLVQDPAQRASALELLEHPFTQDGEKVKKKQMKEMLTTAYQDTMNMFNL